MNGQMSSASGRRWWPAVRIKIGDGFSESITGPDVALQYLAFRWPACESSQREHARLVCMKALQRRCSCDDARHAFVSAAMEARILA